MSITGVENITVPSLDPTLRELDEAGIRWDVEQAVAHGFTATMLALNTGLSPAEMRRFTEIAVDAAGDRLKVGIEMPQGSFALARETLMWAADAGVNHALLSVPVGWEPRDDDEVHAAYSELADASPLRLVLPIGQVGFPMRLSGGVPWGAYARLAGHPNVHGAHVSTWMPQTLFTALTMFRGRLDVGLGSPMQLGALPLLHREHGVSWLGPGHWELWQSPEQRYLVDYVDHVIAGRKEEAMAIHWRLAPARGIAFGAGLLEPELDGMAHWPLAKYVSWSVGGNGGLVREPALRVKAHHMQARQAMLRAIGIEPRTDEREFLIGRSAVG